MLGCFIHRGMVRRESIRNVKVGNNSEISQRKGDLAKYYIWRSINLLSALEKKYFLEYYCAELNKVWTKYLERNMHKLGRKDYALIRLLF